MRFVLDVSACETAEDLHRALAEGLHFPAWYGGNLDALQAAITDASSGASEPAGVLKVSLSPTFGVTHILPLLPELLRRYPLIRPEWHFENRAVDLVAEGYDVAALHYLVKPVSREKLFAVLDRAWEKHRRNARCLNLELSGELVRLPLYEVRYLDVHQNYVTVHARQDYTVKRTLGEFEAQLDEGFLRVGRGMILNLKQIRRVTKKEVVLADGTVLPLPRGAYEPLNRAIIERT